jgi:general stress protein 26
MTQATNRTLGKAHSDKHDPHHGADKVTSTSKKLEQLADLIDGIEIAMLTTISADGLLVSRPMATQKRDPRGTLWFVTSTETQKVDELLKEPRVNLSYYKDRTREFVSVSGLARVVSARAKVRELYSEDWRAWFGDEGGDRNGGPDDPRIVLIAVEAQSAVYLKSDRPQPLVLLSLVKGMITGEPPHVGDVGELNRNELTRGG